MEKVILYLGKSSLQGGNNDSDPQDEIITKLMLEEQNINIVKVNQNEATVFELTANVLTLITLFVIIVVFGCCWYVILKKSKTWLQERKQKPKLRNKVFEMNALPSYTLVSAGMPSYEDVIPDENKKSSFSNQCADTTAIYDFGNYVLV